jgi:hypothetical protein
MDTGFTAAGWIIRKRIWERTAQQGHRDPTVDNSAKQWKHNLLIQKQSEPPIAVCAVGIQNGWLRVFLGQAPCQSSQMVLFNGFPGLKGMAPTLVG